MNPKKATIIILTLFLAIGAVFAILFTKKQISDMDNKSGGDISGQDKNKSGGNENIVSEKINRIIEDAQKNPEISDGALRQEIIETINAEVMLQEENKTSEQKAADLKAQEERQKIIEQINSQIRKTSEQ